MTTLVLGLAALSTPVFADATVTNGVLSVSPSSAPQGTVGLTVTFNLSPTNTPPLPQTLTILPASAMIGTNVGTARARPNLYVVTAQFTIPASKALGLKDAAVSFPLPGGTLTYNRPQPFQVVAGSGIPVAAFTATPHYGTSPLTVNFADASGVIITHRLWDFGDGTTGINVNPIHTYSSVDHVGDGIPDGWRRHYFGGSGLTTNESSCAAGNADGDGAVNYSEYVADTNPTNALSHFKKRDGAFWGCSGGVVSEW